MLFPVASSCYVTAAEVCVCVRIRETVKLHHFYVENKERQWRSSEEAVFPTSSV